MLVTSIGYDERKLQELVVTNISTGEVWNEPTNGVLNKTRVDDVFVHVNKYLATLPDEDSEALFKLFMSEKKYNGLSMSENDYNLRLGKVVKKACKLLDFRRFLEWFRENSDDVFIADKFQEQFVDNPDRLLTEVKTYLVHEYIDFVAMVSFIRMLLPLYLRYYTYLTRSKNKQGAMKVLRLFSNNYFNIENGPLDKLRAYILANHEDIVGTKHKEGMIIGGGISEDDLDDTISGFVIFHRLIIYDFINSKSNPVSFIYSIIEEEGSFKSKETNAIRSKFPSTAKTEDEYSRYESYRKITKLSACDILYSTLNMRELDLLESYPDNVYRDFERELGTIDIHLKTPIEQCRLVILSWLLKNWINPRTLWEVESRTVTEKLLMAKTLLMNSGHTFIGMLLGSVVDNDKSFVSANVITKGTMPKHLSARINELFVYQIIENGVSTNETEILEIGRQILNMPWKPYGAMDLRYVNESGFLVPPNNIYAVLLDVVEFGLKFRPEANAI